MAYRGGKVPVRSGWDRRLIAIQMSVLLEKYIEANYYILSQSSLANLCRPTPYQRHYREPIGRRGATSVAP
jgi:hypothetical protein